MAQTNGKRNREDTRTRALEAELERTVERYELIFKATNDVLYDLHIEAATVVWNEALYTQFGYKRNEPAETLEWWVSHIHPDDALRVEGAVTDYLAEGAETWNVEYRFRRADGSYSDVKDRGFILRDKTGQPQRIIGSFLDVTQQKKLDRAKDEFISLVSHQLRTPLTVIRIYGEMFSNGMLGKLTRDQSTNIKRITDASIRLITLVGGILDISKLELGRFAVKPSLQQANDLIAACIDGVSMLAAEKRVVISFTPDYDLAPVALDPVIFEQILHNLLTNAIRYTLPVKGQVFVRFRRTREGFQLSVKDNGIGIPEAAKGHIFDRFYRADNAVNVEDRGTGLGLYVAKLMAEEFGGKMWFESSEHSGTTFTVMVPLTGMRESLPAV